MKSALWIELGQWLGMLALIVGIALMTWDNRAPGETIIAIASLIYAIATKIKYYRKKRGNHDGKHLVTRAESKSGASARSKGKTHYERDDDRAASPLLGLPETGSPADHDGSKPK